MLDKTINYIIFFIIFIALSVIFILGENLKSYLLSLSILTIATLFFLHSKNGIVFKKLLKDSFYDIKTYTLPNNKYILKLTSVIIFITLIASIFILFLNNILRSAMY